MSTPYPAPAMPVSPAAVRDYWFNPEMRKQWFSGGAELDDDIRQRFGAAVALALAGELTDWESEPQDRLALVILLDQFPRNIFRGKAKAFAGDHRAQHLVSETLASGGDLTLSWLERMQFYMPLMHAEDLPLQEEGVRRYRSLAADAPPELSKDMQSSLQYAEQHRNIVARFGRFPHRNSAQGRTSTALEFAFVKNGPRFGQ
ncbi:MAG TPA: DUF924 family protein [Polaromonas sp.]|uniref:DUF924 family protein n=1 Tax=Polaromonas sp. TaxID=1869339 RepID=UPI002D234F29|nr:DUF924 family protein [Polaromonas sp.]HYW56530.1 DUF924 family protein [Polaromonas sp.]